MSGLGNVLWVGSRGGGANSIPSIIYDGNTIAWYDFQDLSTITKDTSERVSSVTSKLIPTRTLYTGVGVNAQPIYSIDGLTFDGIDDALISNWAVNWKVIYIVLKQITHTNGDYIYSSLNGSYPGIRQRTNSPEISICSVQPPNYTINSNLDIGSTSIIRHLVDSANSECQVNLTSITQYDAGSDIGNGLCIGSYGDGTNTYFSNIRIKEIIIRSIKDSDYNKDIIYSYLNSKYKTTLITETETLTSRFSTPPTNGRKELINTVMNKLITDGVLSKLDVLCLIGADSQSSSQNWVKNACNATLYNSPTFVADRYFQGDSISMRIETNFIDTTPGQLMSLNDATTGIIFTTEDLVGSYNGSNTNILLRGDGIGWIHNAPSGDLGCGHGPGVLSIVRESANLSKSYKNGDYVAQSAVASTANANVGFQIFCYNDATWNSNKIAGWFFGKALTATDQLNLKTAIKLYLDGIGQTIIA